MLRKLWLNFGYPFSVMFLVLMGDAFIGASREFWPANISGACLAGFMGVGCLWATTALMQRHLNLTDSFDYVSKDSPEYEFVELLIQATVADKLQWERYTSGPDGDWFRAECGDVNSDRVIMIVSGPQFHGQYELSGSGCIDCGKYSSWRIKKLYVEARANAYRQDQRSWEDAAATLRRRLADKSNV